MLAVDARYTFVIAHEPPTAPDLPAGTMPIEMALTARPGGVTLRLYGHTHDYRRIATNALIAGNAGAPLAGTTDYFGFVVVEQQSTGDVQVTAYEAGQPAIAHSVWRVHPDGSMAP
jgi:hypothetical protein